MVAVRFADLPQIEGATGRFRLQQMVAVAGLEAGMISARTKAALAAAKKRGKKLGGIAESGRRRRCARSTAVLNSVRPPGPRISPTLARRDSGSASAHAMWLVDQRAIGRFLGNGTGHG